MKRFTEYVLFQILYYLLVNIDKSNILLKIYLLHAKNNNFKYKLYAKISSINYEMNVCASK